MTTIADFITNDPMNGKFRLRAGEDIAKDDLLLLNYKGLAYKATNTVAASVANCTYGTAQISEGTGRIIAETTVDSASLRQYYRQAMAVDDEGMIFALSGSGQYGLKLTKLTSAGTLSGRVVVVGGTDQYYSKQIFILSNGNIACVAVNNTDLYIYYAIYTPDLVTVKALIALPDSLYDNYFSAVKLSSGGFAVVYAYGSNSAQTKMATVSNDGNIVLSPTVIWTRTGILSAGPRHNIDQLSNGNIVVAGTSYNTAGYGLYHGVVSIAGAVVQSFSLLDNYANITWIPELSVMNGYYCIALANNTDQKAWVCNNAGTMQGSAFSAPTSLGSLSLTTKLTNDGVDFFLIWKDNNYNTLPITRIPVTGAGYVTSYIITIQNIVAGHFIDAFCGQGLLIIASGYTGSSSSPVLVVVDTDTLLLLGHITPFGVSATGCSDPRLLPLGDYSFCYMGTQGDSSSTIIIAGKYANTAIIGTAYESAAEGELVRVNGSAGAYVCNPMIGAISKSFDHSASNIVGNKGTIMPNSVALKGI